ncbi:MAG TPA: chemotaxis response regulator protein-glutamate methylesterase [Xanthobacteraceae bacterium]|nr:chemotaxis response regulator protein-glutamate methylesterase [Xanthobacteraceae bacterium]
MGFAVPAAPSAHATADTAIRVMVVDDSVVVRGLVSRWIEEEPGLALAGSLRNGRDAVDQVERINPDVVILDIEMPELDGISALPLLLAKKRDLVVIMASTLTRHNAEISLKALSLGAADYIPKPETNRGVTTSASFRRELIEKVRELGGRRPRKRAPAAPGAQAPAAATPTVHPASAREAAPIKLRPFAPTAPRVLLIGSSTGGPQALTAVISNLRGLLPRVPVLITQHMPPTFTTILAEHIARAASSKAHEGVDGEPVEPGTIYIAPGGKHMQAVKRDHGPVIALDDGPLVNFCKPAVDPLFRSAAALWGPAVLAVVLTGMGSDGAKGGAEIVAHGGSVIAQDEASSVVWGMPGAAAHAGVCSAVLPLDQIAPKVMRLFSGERS